VPEGPWKLPDGWRWAAMEEVAAEVQSGFAHGKKRTTSGDLLHLRPYNIGLDGELALDKQFLIPKRAAAIALRRLLPGDVLFNNTNSVELVGKTAIVRDGIEAAFSNHITRIRPRAELCTGEWLALCLRGLWQQGFFARRCNKWIGQAGYNTQALAATPVPLPPLPDQRRIVGKIEALFERIREAKRLQAEAGACRDSLTDVASLEAFSCPEAKTWERKRFGDVWRERARYGTFKKPQAEPTGNPIVRVGNVVGGSLILGDLKYVEVTEKEFARFELRDGDLVVARAIGSRSHLGKCAVFRQPADCGTFVLDSHLIRIRLDEGQALPQYVWRFLTSPLGRKEILQNSRQSAIQFNINTKELRSLRIPLPTLVEQRAIVDHLTCVSSLSGSLASAQQASAAGLDRLEQSVLDMAFRGEL